jgi:hypothetical protein
MPYIGNTPADKFLTLAKQNFSTSATTSYTLDSSVSSTQDIALFINNVRQSPVDAYTVSGTALTLTSATAGTDEMYCVYLGKTVGTVSPSVNSITNAMMTDDSVGLAELSATGTPSSSNFLRGDNAWATAGGDLSFGGDTFGADKTVGANDAYAFSLETSGNTAIKMDASGVVTKPLQPSFRAYNNSATSYTGSADLFTSNVTEVHDKNGDFNVSTGVFTAPVDGIYLFTFSLMTTGTTDAAASTFESIIVTSNGQSRALRMCARNDYTMFGSYMKEFCSTTIFLDASDTAKVTAAWGATETLFASSQNSYFAGDLLG